MRVWQLSARGYFRGFASSALLAAMLGTGAAPAFSQGVVAGQNVNMVGGPWSWDPSSGRIVGDPFLQRQNEPSLAVSSRNPCHLLGGANDYRAVDVPGLPGEGEVGDAWLGVFKSIDCGHTWSSTLLPGYRQDLSAEGMASPLKGLAAAADATVRPGPGGIIYYSGIAFNRGDNGVGKVFVSRFIDRNDKEKGDPIRYVGAAAVDSGTSGQFLDKPWIAVDIPRGTGTCSVDGEVVPAAPVYLVYTSFVGNTNNPRSKIMFSKSTDCGATWSNPAKLSERIAINQGTTVAVGPDGTIYVAWREFANQDLDPNDPSTLHSILFARSTDGGKTFTKAQAIDASLRPFDQGSTGVSFRTNAFPTMAVDGTGRVYVAWAARGQASARRDPVTGDARIVVATSGDRGTTWTSPRVVVDDEGLPGHQIMPALTIAAGKLMLVYYDFRDDLSGVFGQYVNEAEVAQGPTGLRHTMELRAAMADPDDRPMFTDYLSIGDERPSTQVTGYAKGSYYKNGERVLGRLQFNPPNLPMFAQGSLPFIGDYLDVAAQTFVLDENRRWVFNTDADPAGRRLPLFHATWSDNRDVRRPPAGQTWADYKSPSLGPSGEICDAGTNPGSRNQNIYTAPLMPGLVVTSPGNQKTLRSPLRGSIQRAYVVYARNATDQDRSYTLTVSPAPAGSWASFTRIDEGQLPAPILTSQIGPILIPRRSSISRSVFLVSTNQAYPAVTVQVTEVAGGGEAAAVAAVTLNADLQNPDIANPDIANPDIANPDIANAEVYNPDIANVTIDNPDIANPDIANPDIANPDIANPDIANPDIANSTVANPDIANPDIANPDIANPDIANPDIANPDIANAAAYDITDVTWSVQNNGNTTAAYAFKAKLTKELPAGAQMRLIVRRVYVAPQANAANQCAEPEPAIQNQLLVNIPNPELDADLFASFDPQTFRDNASFFLAPSDEGRVTLRIFCPQGNPGCAVLDDAGSLVAARVEAQAPNNCAPGATEANCQLNGFQPDDIYDTTAPVTACTVNGADCGAGPFYVRAAASVSLAPTDAVGVQQTICTIDGEPCPAGLTFPVEGEGSHTISFQSRDHSGNLEPLRTFVVHVDGSSPAVAGFVGFPELGSWTSAASITGTVDVTDATSVTVSCSDSVAGGTTVSGLSITVAGDGSHLVSCSVTDQAGNTTDVSTTVNLDTGVPTVAAAAAVVTAEASGPTGAIVSYAIAAAEDTLSGATVECTPPSGSTFPVGSTAVTCTATDGAGNSATATFAVTVTDTTPPVVMLNGGASVSAEAGPAFIDPGATASDSVAGALPVSVSGAVSAGSVGTYVLTYSATDPSGNTGTAVRTVTVVDTTPPVVTLNGAAVMSIEAGSAFADPGATASDVAAGTLPVTIGGAVTAGTPGVYTLTYSATDPSGNTGSATRTITVVDTTRPSVTVNGSAVMSIEAGSAFVDPGATATDGVAGTLPVSISGAVAVGTPGTYTLTYSATDPSGNTGSATRTVTVVDTTPPVVTLVGGASASLEAGSVFTDPGATAADSVAGSLPVSVSGTVNTGTPGTYSLTYSATDPSGNTGSASRTITVVDTTPPSVTVSVTPTSIWSPTGKLVPVTVSGIASDRGGLSRVTFTVVDEYRLVQPSGTVSVGSDGSYSFAVNLQASRTGSDKDGRTYTITVTAVDRAGLQRSSMVSLVAVEHNQSK